MIRSVKGILRIWISACTLALTATSHASIAGQQRLSIDFTHQDDAKLNAVWSPSDKLTVTNEGLGWEGEPIQSVEGWIQTKPLAVGESWRTASSTGVSVTIGPAPTSLKSNHDQTGIPWNGSVFARFSPDAKHWSTWQQLKQVNPTSQVFSGLLSVPDRERANYSRLLQEYSNQDVPWRSDEEAAVKWILLRDPNFFQRSLPFVGYVQVLFEVRFPGGQRIASLQVDAGFGMSGLHYPPTDPESAKGRYGVPWRFKAE
jgi:hypothetical protein